MSTHDRFFKDSLYEQFARIGKAVANPHRLELIDILAQSERRVEDLASETGLSIANASHHLQALKQAGLVETRRAGTSIYYHLADDRVFRLWQAIRDLGEARLADVDRIARTFLANRADLETVDADTLTRRLSEGDVIVLDVRPEVEYRAGHIRGARSIPIEELEARLAELPIGCEVVAYCRGPYCVFSDEAVALLRDRGYRATLLGIGLPEWRLAGLPVATS